MLTGIIVITIIFCFFIFFIIYKRRMLIHMFSLNISHLSQEFQGQIESTADVVIKRMQHQIDQLEFLLDEANQKIEALGDQIRAAENLTRLMNHPPSEVTVFTPSNHSNQEEKAVLIPNNNEIELETEFNPECETGRDTDKRQIVLQMDEQGYSVTDIAKVTSMGQGEVMLLLQLNKK